VRSTQQFSITLPNEMAEAVRSKVAAGEYATESEVIRDGLRALLARDRAVESWLREQVAPAYDALKADPPLAPSASASCARRSPLNTARPSKKRNTLYRRPYTGSAGTAARALSIHCGRGLAGGRGTLYQRNYYVLRRVADLPATEQSSG
jgi:putative addiction module CopG family antidote